MKNILLAAGIVGGLALAGGLVVRQLYPVESPPVLIEPISANRVMVTVSNGQVVPLSQILKYFDCKIFLIQNGTSTPLPLDCTNQ